MCRWLCRLSVGAVSVSQRHPSFHLSFISQPSKVTSRMERCEPAGFDSRCGLCIIPLAHPRPSGGHSRRLTWAFLTVDHAPSASSRLVVRTSIGCTYGDVGGSQPSCGLADTGLQDIRVEGLGQNGRVELC